MKTVNDLFNEASKEQKTLSVIASELFNVELSGLENFTSFKEPFCTVVKSEEGAKAFFIYLKYECNDVTSRNKFSNGFHKAIIEKDGFVYDIESVRANTIIEM
jgi:hypothetical protein